METLCSIGHAWGAPPERGGGSHSSAQEESACCCSRSPSPWRPRRDGHETGVRRAGPGLHNFTKVFLFPSGCPNVVVFVFAENLEKNDAQTGLPSVGFQVDYFLLATFISSSETPLISIWAVPVTHVVAHDRDTSGEL